MIEWEMRVISDAHTALDGPSWPIGGDTEACDEAVNVAGCMLETKSREV
jgi:hypothetical protein